MGNFSEADLNRMGLQKNPDGSYSKAKTQLQPREKAMGKTLPEIIDEQKTNCSPEWAEWAKELPKTDPDDSQAFRTLKLTLFGEPMPKQGDKSYIKNGKIMHYQPQDKVDRLKEYQMQIRKQLPPGFRMFETCVFITKMHFVYSPLKRFHKEKGKMDAIRRGVKFYKNTIPDLPDNLKKLVNDSMTGIVFRDDGIICGEDDVKKYYGIGGCVIIEIKGY